MNYSVRLSKVVPELSQIDNRERVLRLARKLVKAEDTYTVKPGDTLSGIAEKEYGDAKLWEAIYEANRDLIDDPDKIQSGWELRIPDQGAAKQEQEQRSRSVAEQAEQRGLVSLEGVAQVKNHPYVVPELKEIASEISNFPGVKKLRITEAWPPTSRHLDRNHFNGRAMDFTIHDWPNTPTKEELHVAKQVSEYLKSQGYDVVNEYTTDTLYKTGAHIHVDMGNKPSVVDRVAKSKKPITK